MPDPVIRPSPPSSLSCDWLNTSPYVTVQLIVAVVCQVSCESVDLAKASGSLLGLSLAVVVGIAVGSFVILLLLILVIVRYRRQQQRLKAARMMVIAHQGDIQFGEPESPAVV